MMNSTSTQFVPSRRIEMYDSIQGIWGDNFKTNFAQNSLPLPPIIIDPQTNFDNQSEVTSHGPINTPPNREQQTFKTYDKVQRRLAQNREAARKSRLRKKAYVQQLEAGRLKLMELELEYKRPQHHQGLSAGSGLHPNDLTFSSPINTGISGFEIEYRQWIEEQKRQIGELRHALNSHRSDIELKVLVEGGMSHYLKLFEMKAVAARTDVFYVMCGMWKTSSERFFLWMGGCRPSELLKALVQQLDPLSDQQLLDVYNLTQSCHQAEDALSQGMDKLQRTLSETVAFTHLTDATTGTLQKLEALVSFVIQADHLRQEALQQMSRILTTRQAARGLLALGEYFQRLRSLSSLWTSHPQQST